MAPGSAAKELGMDIVEMELDIGDTENLLLQTKQFFADTELIATAGSHHGGG